MVQGTNTLYMYMPLEDMLQNEAVGMAFFIDMKPDLSIA